MKIQGIRAGELMLHDGIMLSAESPGVKRDENGVPIEWTLLKIGENPIVKNGDAGSLTLSGEDMKSIVDYFESKGELIPVDSNHYLHELANIKKLDESEVLRLLPSGVAAMGYGSLALNGDELRFKVKWTPTAYELMKEKIFKYFSPALRGLVKGPLRLTSVAMENEPAINHLDALAASANLTPSDRSDKSGRSDRKESMGKLESALGRLLRRDSLALSGETSNEEKDKIACEVEEKADLLEQIKKLMGLAEEAGNSEIAAALKAIIDKAAGADEKQQKLDEMAASAEKAEHARLVAVGKSQGKVGPWNQAWVDSLDSKALSAALPHMAVQVNLKTVTPDTRRADDNDVALSADEERIIRTLGIKKEDYLNEKKGA